MLSINKVDLGLILDDDVHLFFEKGMRAWVSHISKRYSKANNKYLKSYDTKEVSKHIIYLDANNSCGHAISKFLSTGKYKWI